MARDRQEQGREVGRQFYQSPKHDYMTCTVPRKKRQDQRILSNWLTPKAQQNLSTPEETNTQCDYHFAGLFIDVL